MNTLSSSLTGRAIAYPRCCVGRSEDGAISPSLSLSNRKGRLRFDSFWKDTIHTYPCQPASLTAPAAGASQDRINSACCPSSPLWT